MNKYSEETLLQYVVGSIVVALIWSIMYWFAQGATFIMTGAIFGLSSAQSYGIMVIVAGCFLIAFCFRRSDSMRAVWIVAGSIVAATSLFYQLLFLSYENFLIIGVIVGLFWLGAAAALVHAKHDQVKNAAETIDDFDEDVVDGTRVVWLKNRQRLN